MLSGLTQPTAVRFASDGRVFVAEKSGIIKVFASLTSTTPTVFADLRTNVHNFWDRGLLGLALPPDFPTNPYVYVLYTYDATIGGTAPRWGTAGATYDGCATAPGWPGDGCVVSGRLSRLQASGNVMVGAEQVLVEDWCQQFPTHSMGGLAFGQDGALYVSAGDGASSTFVDYGQKGTPPNACGDPPLPVGGSQTAPTAEGGALRSQDLRTAGDPTTLDGTVLRLDPLTGAALPDNPLFGGPVADDDRIVAFGLRHPFRIAARPGTNEIWVGDVGWSTAEEIDRIASPTTAALNFGWPCYEGSGAQAAYAAANLDLCKSLYAAGAGAVTAPLYSYGRSDVVVPNDGCATGTSSVSGLAFYAGASYPPAYNGALFFADYARGCIWTMFKSASGAPDPATRATFVSGAAHPIDLQAGPNGDLFYVDLDGGTVRRVQYYPGNTPPIAVATADVTNGPTTLTVHFDGTGSSDPDPGDTITYDWDLNGDGIYGDSSLAAPSFAYGAPGVYTARLRVTDLLGASSEAAIQITAGNSAPVPTIVTPTPATSWAAGDSIAFSGSATDDQALSAAAYTWTLVLDQCPSTCTAHVLDVATGVTSGTFTAPDVDYPALLEVRLTVTDAGGLSATTSVTLPPKTVALDLNSTPTGLALALGGNSQVTPFTGTVITGAATSLGGLSPQLLGANSFGFGSWSDGGANSHLLIAPATSASYTATFTASCVDGTVSCDDGNPCTTDTCDPSLGCLHTPATCSDGNACTADTCDPAVGCVFTPITCSDGNACTTDTCDPAVGCVFTPITCNDGNACTADTCDPVAGCVFTLITCNDNNVCTDDSCDPATGCVFTNNTAPCDDKNVCTTNDTCQNGTCVGGTAVNCDDGNLCTDDICDSHLGCLHANNSSACTDGNSCTAGDACNSGVCVGGNTATGCSSCQAIATIPPQGGIFLGTPSGTSALSGSCSSTNVSPERIYQWTPTTSGQATIQTCGAATTYDTVLYLRSGDCASGTELACNDDTQGCQTGEPSAYHGSKITPTVTAGQTYYIVVDGYGGRNGTFSLSVTPPGLCGNNVRDGSEQCDGTDAANCPSGQCTAVCTCVPPSNALPDLVPAIEGLYFQYNTTVGSGDVIEGCAEATSGVDLLRFGVLSINQGTADWFLGDPGCPLPCDQHPLAACTNPDFICSPAQGHNHAHYNNYARYELLDSTGQAVIVGHKQGFCLLDSICPAGTTPKYACTNQGLTAGCSDIYGANLGCQYLDITGVPAGNYTLRVTIDPFQKIRESNETNNVVTMPVTLGNGSVGACSNPTVIPSGGGTISGMTSGVSSQAGTCGGSGAPENAFQWTPTVSGTATIQTCDPVNTNFDTVLYVREGGCGNGTEMACNDDTVGCGIVGDGSQPRHGSSVSVNVTAGIPYFILVDGYGAFMGNFTLTVTPPAGTPTTTTVTTTSSTTLATTTTSIAATTTTSITTTTIPTTTSTSTTIPTTTSTTVTTTTSTSSSSTTSTTVSTTTTTSTTSTTLPGVGTCASPLTLPPDGGTFAGTTSGTSIESGTCAPTTTSPERVYQWTPVSSGTATINTCNATATTFDTVVYVRQGTCSGGTQVSCNDDTVGCAVAGDGANPHRGSQVTFPVTAGQTYYVVVDGWSGGLGSYSLTVALATTTSTTTSTSTSTTSTTSTTLPPTTCGAPTIIPATGGTFTATTSGTSAQAGTCAPTSTSPESVFQWTPATSGVATIQTCSATATSFDTVLYMRQGTCGTGTQVACNDDTPGCATTLDGTNPHRGSTLSPTVTAGQTYFIFVDGYNGVSGNFSLTVLPPP